MAVPASSQFIVEARPATTVSMPSRADSNSPAYWDADRFLLLNSTGKPVISQGSSAYDLGQTQTIQVDAAAHQPMWFESVWRDPDGSLYAWYHHEPVGLCRGSTLTAPKIGAAVSHDGGRSFVDLGIVLESGDPIDCNAKNGFFGSGHGDFSVIPDRTGTYFYFLFDNYGGDASEQGVAIARMAFEDRTQPVGMVWKYHNEDWQERGLGGRMTPIFPVRVAWQQSNTDAFWGPSVHWNTYLEKYVVLMSRSCCKPNWPQEGIYLTVNADLSDPAGWSQPGKIMGKITYDAGFYPQVIGTQPGESDTIAGQTSRLFVHGRSQWELMFWKLEDLAPPDPTPDPDRP